MTRSDLVRLRRATDRMDRDYARRLDVPALADGAVRSPPAISRAASMRYSWETPYGYLTRRMERAKALLGVYGSKITAERDFDLPRLSASCRRG